MSSNSDDERARHEAYVQAAGGTWALGRTLMGTARTARAAAESLMREGLTPLTAPAVAEAADALADAGRQVRRVLDRLSTLPAPGALREADRQLRAALEEIAVAARAGVAAADEHDAFGLTAAAAAVDMANDDLSLATRRVASRRPI